MKDYTNDLAIAINEALELTSDEVGQYEYVVEQMIRLNGYMISELEIENSINLVNKVLENRGQ
jgi:hypothetical protein